MWLFTKGLVILLLFFITLYGCSGSKDFPKEIYTQTTYDIKTSIVNDTLLLEIKNNLHCPVRYTIKADEQLLQQLKGKDIVLLQAHEDTAISFRIGIDKNPKLSYSTAFGDPEKEIVLNTLSLPFLVNKKYKIIQGYQSSYSHNSSYSGYAIDFSMKIGDTVCSADDGYVVGVVKDYKYGGSSKQWKENDKSNFITVYHPHSGLFTQYVHLKHKSSFVKVGDTVLKHQPIGLSGMTGYTDVEHLHFNALIPYTEGTLKSIPVEFENGVSGISLRKGVIAEKK